MKSIILNKKYKKYKEPLNDYYDKRVKYLETQINGDIDKNLDALRVESIVTDIYSYKDLAKYAKMLTKDKLVFEGLKWQNINIKFENDSTKKLIFKDCILGGVSFRVNNIGIHIINSKNELKDIYNDLHIEGKNVWLNSNCNFQSLSFLRSSFNALLNKVNIKSIDIYNCEVSIVTHLAIVESFRLANSTINVITLNLDKTQVLEYFPTDITSSHALTNNNEYSSPFLIALGTTCEIYRKKFMEYQYVDREQWYYYFMMYKLCSTHLFPERVKNIKQSFTTNKTSANKFKIFAKKHLKSKEISRLKSVSKLELYSRFFVNPYLLFKDMIKCILTFSIIYLVIGLKNDTGLLFSISHFDANNISVFDLFNNLALSIYFSFATFSTVGYGDLSMRTGFELITVIEMMLGISFIGVFTGSIFKRYVD